MNWCELALFSFEQNGFAWSLSLGAEWIWNLTGDYFRDSEQIVDWYHACEQLARVSAAIYPDEPQWAQG